MLDQVPLVSEKSKRFRKGMLKVFDIVYHANSTVVSPFNKIAVNELEQRNLYPCSRLICFMGLPHVLNQEETNYKRRLVEKFFGWKSASAWWRNGLRAIPVGLWHLVTIVPKLMINVVKFVTEVLPISLLTLFTFVSVSHSQHINQSRKLRWMLTKTFYFVACALYLFGHAITSPNHSAHFSYHLGKDLGGNRMGILLAMMSGLITLGAYIILSPLLLKIFISALLPYASYLPLTLAKYLTAKASTSVFSPLNRSRHFLSKLRPFVGPGIRAMGMMIIVLFTELSFMTSVLFASMRKRLTSYFADFDDHSERPFQNETQTRISVAHFRNLILDEQMTIVIKNNSISKEDWKFVYTQESSRLM